MATNMSLVSLYSTIILALKIPATVVLLPIFLMDNMSYSAKNIEAILFNITYNMTQSKASV